VNYHSLKLVTYLKEEQSLAEEYLEETSIFLTNCYNTKFTVYDLLEIASSAHQIAARRKFNSILVKHDVYVDSKEINQQIDLIVAAYNSYAILMGFANCVGDQIAQIAHDRVLAVKDVWPKDAFGSLMSSLQVYSTSDIKFRQGVRAAASTKLNFKNSLGSFTTLTYQERVMSNVTVTPVEELCSWVDQIGTAADTTASN
jgi:hypothetical protein